MSDESPSIVVASPVECRAEALTSEAVESILSDFRLWLQQAKEIPDAAPPPSMDLATVVQQFTALRQDVNLQTKSSRAVLEQNAQLAEMLRQAQQGLSEQQARLQEIGQQERNEALRPLLKALIEAHDALSLARREVQRQLDNVPEPEPEASELPLPSTIEIRLPFWARWLGLEKSVEEQIAPLRPVPKAAPSARVPQRSKQILDALLAGYEMSLQRLERSLQNQGLEVIACVGQSFDPETMEVVEVIRETGRSGTEVLAVVRNGYLWKGRLFRFAQVRVAKA